MPVADGLWPVLVTAAAVWIVLRLGIFRAIQSLPAGDVLALITHVLRLSRLSHHFSNGLARFSMGWGKLQMGILAALTGLSMIVKERLQQMENYLSRWDVAMLCAIIVAVGMGAGFIWINVH